MSFKKVMQYYLLIYKVRSVYYHKYYPEEEWVTAKQFSVSIIIIVKFLGHSGLEIQCSANLRDFWKAEINVFLKLFLHPTGIF